MMTADRRRVPPGAGPPGRQRLGRVLLVEDEQDVAELIRYNLTKEGYDVVLCGERERRAPAGPGEPPRRHPAGHHGAAAQWLGSLPAHQEGPELAAIPVIMVSGRVEEGDKVLGFEVGADDYVTKPFSPRELIARIRAVLRRGRQADAKEKKASLKVGDLEIDRYRFEVRMKNRPVELTPKEFELLATLVGAPGRVFGREELLDLVWGRDGFVEPRTVDVHVARLRGKFAAAKLEEPGIETVRGVGYRFRDKP